MRETVKKFKQELLNWTLKPLFGVIWFEKTKLRIENVIHNTVYKVYNGFGS
jgi:hypothetical protein